MTDVAGQQRQHIIETYFELFKDDEQMQILAERLLDLYEQSSESVSVE